MRKSTIGSLFSGIGGLDLAAQWAGFETAWFVEKEPFCQQVLAKHWPNTPIHSDVFDCKCLPHVDVIVGGFPCQPFSVAGKRQGSTDERFLLPEMLRIIDEVQPYAVLFENVPGFPSLNHGAEFKQLLGALAEMGFDAEWGHLRASDFGAPHQRERWFCVAYTVRNGNGDSGNGGTCSNQKQHGEPPKREWLNKQFGTIGNGQVVGNASSLRCEFDRTQSGIAGECEDKGRLLEFTGTGNRQSESRLGRDVDGLPAGMDFVGWPARPNEPQYAYEPPRVSPSAPNRTARLKALGNAVVPQAAYPLMVAIHEWLENNYA